MAEIADAELAQLREVASFMEGLMAHPEARRKVLEAVKTRDPAKAIPELDAKGEVLTELEKEREARKALEARLDKADADRELATQRATFANQWEREKDALRAQGYMDDGIAKIEAHAHKFGIPSLDVAAAHWEKLNPPRQVIQPSGGTWNFFDTPEDADPGQVDFMKKMMESHGDDAGALDAEIYRTLNDSRNQRAR